MQIKKAGVVATGALATLAVMGAPAAAAPTVDATAFTKASPLDLARGGGWDAPWDQPAQSAISVGTGTALQGAIWQSCGGTATWGVGGVADLMSPNTVLGECNNGNIKLKLDTIPGVISVLADSAVSVGTWQSCGSSTNGGVGGALVLMSPNTVVGDCKNGNVIITREPSYEESTTVDAELVRKAAANVNAKKDDAKAKSDQAARAMWATRQASAKAPAAAPAARHPWTAPWIQEPQSAISVASGSVGTGATWQSCGGEAVWGVGGVVSGQSPSTVWGDCDNANVWIDQDDPTAVISVIDSFIIGLADWQSCGSTTMGGVGGTVNLGSPNTVFGSCNNGNKVID